MEFKQEAITFAEENGNNSATRRFGVAVKRVREWRQNKDAIIELCAKPQGSKKEKLRGGGRKKSYLNGSMDADPVDFEFLEL